MGYTKRDKSMTLAYRAIEDVIYDYCSLKARLVKNSKDADALFKVRAIEVSLAEFCKKANKREFVNAMYLEGRRKAKDVRDALGISQNASVGWRNEFIQLVGEKLGVFEE